MWYVLAYLMQHEQCDCSLYTPNAQDGSCMPEPVSNSLLGILKKKKNKTASEKYFFSHYKQAHLTLAKPSYVMMCIYQKGVKITA